MESNWRAEDRPCPVCGSSERRFIGRRGGSAHRQGKGIVTNVVCCVRCSTLYAHPTLVPTINPYAAEDPDQYFRLHDRDLKEKTGRSLARTAESMLGRAGRVLEVGCGCGDLLEGARSAGWEAFGIELTPAFAARARAKGLVVEENPAETAALLDGEFDFIIFAAVLEHLYRPMDVLRKARRALRAGGVLFIDVPNEASIAMTAGNLYMRLRRRDWCVNLSPTFAPFHVVGFSPRSLRYALRLGGFEVARLSTPTWGNNLPAPHSFWDRIEHGGLTLASGLGSPMGAGDGLVCWATATDFR